MTKYMSQNTAMLPWLDTIYKMEDHFTITSSSMVSIHVTRSNHIFDIYIDNMDKSSYMVSILLTWRNSYVHHSPVHCTCLNTHIKENTVLV